MSNGCALFISHSGKSKETIHMAEAVKKAGTKVIIITSQANFFTVIEH
jgi:RpiR family carbohydrate utilization transcriptional regulator